MAQEGFDQESHLADSEEYEARKAALCLALEVLDERERHIFEARRLVDSPLTLERLAMKFRISRERVRQIETRAFKKVQKAAHAASEHAPAMTEYLSGGFPAASVRPALPAC